MRGGTCGTLRRLLYAWACVSAIALAEVAQAQGLYLAPEQTETDRVRSLCGDEGPVPLAVEVRYFVSGDNNVLSFGETGAHSRTPRTFNGGSAHLATSGNTSIAVMKGRWAFSYQTTTADLYEGNADAAKAYLNSIAGPWTPDGSITPQATMNRTAATRYSVRYNTPLKMGRGATLYLTASYVRLSRVQLGSLTSFALGAGLHGAVSLLTTRGLPSGDVDGWGLTTDAGLVQQISPSWRGGIWVDNLLGHAWLRSIQQIDATVDVGEVQADADGFLHSLPLLGGTVRQRGLDAAFRRRFDLGLANHSRPGDWLMLLRYDYDWRADLGLAVPVARGGRAWFLLSPTPFEWQAGLDLGAWRLQFGESALNPADAYRGVVSVAYRLTLGR